MVPSVVSIEIPLQRGGAEWRIQSLPFEFMAL